MYVLTAIKRRFIPEWLFALVVYSCRFVETDLSECPRLRKAFLTESFHYHDIGRPIRGKRCRKCSGPTDQANSRRDENGN